MRAVCRPRAPPRRSPARTRSSRGRGPCDTSDRRANGSGGSLDRVISSSGAGPSRYAACRRAGDETRRTESCACRSGPSTWTVASSAASATHMSDGCVAMQWSDAPRMACMRLKPVDGIAADAGFRLLQRAGFVVEVVGSGSAASDCRRRSPCCGSARTRRTGSPGTAPDSARGSADDRPRRCCLTAAPMREAAVRRLARSRSAADRVTSTSASRLLDVLAHQVDQVGPAAEELRVATRRRSASAASPRRCAREYEKFFIATPRRRFADGRARCRRKRRNGTGCRSCAPGSPRRSSSARAGENSVVTALGTPPRNSASMPIAEQIWPGVQ